VSVHTRIFSLLYACTHTHILSTERILALLYSLRAHTHPALCRTVVAGEDERQRESEKGEGWGGHSNFSDGQTVFPLLCVAGACISPYVSHSLSRSPYARTHTGGAVSFFSLAHSVSLLYTHTRTHTHTHTHTHTQAVIFHF